MSGSNSPRGEQEQQENQMNSSSPRGEDEQQENQMNSSSPRGEEEQQENQMDSSSPRGEQEQQENQMNSSSPRGEEEQQENQMDSSSPRGEQEQQENQMNSSSPRGEQEQQENQMNSSSTVSSISEDLDPAQLGISLPDLDLDVDVDVEVEFTDEELMSYIWPEVLDAGEYGPINSSRIMAVQPEGWIPPAYAPDNDNWYYDDLDEAALKDLVKDSDPKVAPSIIGAGLANLGNTCFLNSIMQCFTHTVPLVEGIFLCRHSPTDGHNGFCVICAFRYQMQQSFQSTGRVISPVVLVDNLKHFSSMFRRHQQEDAHEFMQCALDKLDSCFLYMKKNDPNLEEDSIVKKIFGGSLVSKLRCCNCGRSSDTNEPSIDLSLEIENVDTISSALESFTMVENIDAKFKCEGCNEEVSLEKQLMLDQTPSIAAFHLKRFKTDGISVEKIDKHINFPLELDLQPYTINENNNASLKYDLYAVVVHTGVSSTSGHYFCFVRTAPDTWHKLDDSMVTKVSEETVLSQEAYILFYARQGTPWFSNFVESTTCLDLSRMNTSPKSVLDVTDADGQDKSFSILNEKIGRSGAGKSKEFSEKSDYSCRQSHKFLENDDVIDASPCREQFPVGASNQKTLHLNGLEDINAEVLPVNCASSTGIAKPGGSSYAENVAPNKNKCSLEVNGFTENDGFNPLTPPNSPPSQTPGKSFQISRDHLKTEKQGSSDKRSSSSNKLTDDDPQNKAAIAYVKNMHGSRRGAFLDLLGASPENKRKKTDSSQSDKDSDSARKKSSHASVGSYPVAAGTSQ